MFPRIKSLDTVNATPVKNLMNVNFRTITKDNTLLDVVQAFNDSHIDTLPVVDNEENLIGVFPRRRLYAALLEHRDLNASCAPYIVYSPRVNYSERIYHPASLVNRVFNSPVGMVPVLDPNNKLVGMIGKLEYLRETLGLTMKSYVLLESIFEAMYEGMIVVDNEGYIMMINPSAENMFDLNFADIKDKFLEKVLPDLKFHNKPRYMYRSNVKSIPVLINQSPIMSEGEQIGLNIAFVDMSDIESIVHELETVKELESTLSGVISSRWDGVIVSDKNGIVKYANQSACDLCDMCLDGIIGKAIRELFPENLYEQVASTGIPEVDVIRIKENSYVVSYIPIKEDISINTTGIVITIYGNDDKLYLEFARKYFLVKQQAQYYRDELEKIGHENSSFKKIATKNTLFIRMKQDAQRIARSSSTILLTGESGVGKDMFARAIHAASPRAKYSFVKVNCAAIPETLFESELFGYNPGSFTGASKRGKIGYFGQADHGTIFLDEIGDMPLSIQVKILQVLQDKQFMKVGGTSTESIDVRIIAATNRDLREAIANGTFREDLFYRLNVIEFYLPPLRNRSEDILPLAELFVQKYNNILGSNVIGISKKAQEALVRHKWPGNIRELENAIERAANYAWEGEIELEHLPPDLVHPNHGSPGQASYKTVLSEVDRDIIIDVLKKTDGNKSAAARLLKISRSALYEKLAKYGIP